MAIGTGWKEGSWVDAGWVAEAWSDVVDVVTGITSIWHHIYRRLAKR